MSVGPAKLAHVFEGVADVELIEVIGEATRDESTAIAQRLLGVGQLYARRAVELAEWNQWRIDPTDEVAAEISAAQNISHARAVGQIRYGRALCERLPAVATVFARGVIDFRMVLMIIARTDNVEDTLIAELDAAIARHAEKWMKLSKPKLRDRIDLWVAKFDPAAVRVPPAVDDTRCLDVDPAQRWVGLRGRPCSCRRRRRTRSAARSVGRHGVRARSAHQSPAPRRCLWAVGARAGHAWPASVAATTARPVQRAPRPPPQ